MPHTTTDVQGVNSVEIAVSILEAIAEHETPLRATDIARMVGLSKSRLHKYLVSLCRRNMLHQDPETNLYSLGNALVALCGAADRQNKTLNIINEALARLRDRLNVSTGLVVRKGNMLNLIKYNRSNRSVDIDYRDNTSFPLTESAPGKIFLTFGEKIGNESVLDQEKQQQIISDGYAVRKTETVGLPGAKAIACPIFNKSCQLIGAAIMVGFLPESEEKLQELALELLNTVKNIKL